MVELVTSAGLVGAILGALFCGKITDILGRKVVILASAVIFTIGALWSGFAPSIEQLIIARLFLGIAIGVSSFAVPLYIAEISPANKRGSLVSMFQLMITIGVLASYVLYRSRSGFNSVDRYGIYARESTLVDKPGSR